MKHFKLLSDADGLVGSSKNISWVWLGLVQKFWVGLFSKKRRPTLEEISLRRCSIKLRIVFCSVTMTVKRAFVIVQCVILMRKRCCIFCKFFFRAALHARF